MRRRSRYGWLELIEGILLILLGIYTLCNPGGMLRGITFAYGFLAVITGIFTNSSCCFFFFTYDTRQQYAASPP